MSKKQVLKTAARRKPCFAAGDFLRKAFVWGAGALGLLISASFFNGTYDNAQIKITLFYMGCSALCAWWLAAQAQEKRALFTKENFCLYLPFICYYGWNVITFLGAPYRAEGSEEFFRCVFYGLLTLGVVAQFRLGAAKVFAKWLTAAAWISFSYGLLQAADRWLPGLDFMPWRGFFAGRVFSTHANPNFFGDFIIFSSCLIGAEYLRTRSKKYLVLLGMGVVNLFFTESKGAWVGFAAAAVFFAGLYANTLAAGLKKHIKKLNAAAAVFLLGAFVLTGVYAAKRFESVSFRLHTWAAAAQMALDSPVFGTGVGSFKIIYPAYRKAQIFYIENQHNTETQHAENEYLEQWATGGTVGLALFLWLAFFVLAFGVKNLRRMEGETARSCLLLGYTAAFFGILAHGAVDISLRFVSTGFFFAVFAGMILVLGRERGEEDSLSAAETSAREAAPNRRGWTVVVARWAFYGCAAWMTVRWTAGFAQTAWPVWGLSAFGSVCLRVAAWGVFLGALGAALYVYVRAVWKSRTLRVIVILGLSLAPADYFFRYYLADYYYGVATALAGRNLLAGALDYYQKAIDANPLAAEYYQHRAAVMRMLMEGPRSAQQTPGRGGVSQNDYQRIEQDLEKTRSLAPNHALLHQTRGEFYYTAALRYTQLSAQASGPYEYNEYRSRAVDNMNKAKAAFAYSLLLDPVNERTYAYLISIAMMERNAAEAQKWIDAYKKGPSGVTEPEFLERHRQNPRILQMERDLKRMPFYVPSATEKRAV